MKKNASESTMGCHIIQKSIKFQNTLFLRLSKIFIRQRKINLNRFNGILASTTNQTPQYVVHHKFIVNVQQLKSCNNIVKAPNPVLHIRATPKTRSGNISSSTTRVPDYLYSRGAHVQQHKRGENFIQ